SMQRSFPQPPVQRIALFAQTGPALVEALPYTFIFATRRQDSLMSMNDAVCSYRRRINAYSHQGTLAEAWFAQQERERTETHLQQLYQDTLQQGKASRIRRWPDLRQKLLLAHFGQFLQSDYDTIIQQLLLDQAVRCEWRKPANSEEAGLQIPGNDDTLFWR
ncbi:MAG TPA: hypothetical protein VKR06_13065, partial [Ktedonosporobacter sp.]|nr:hypothetical protein [Ktedonosporobacter sp.]